MALTEGGCSHHSHGPFTQSPGSFESQAYHPAWGVDTFELLTSLRMLDHATVFHSPL